MEESNNRFSFLLAARHIGNDVAGAVLRIEHQTRRTVLHATNERIFKQTLRRFREYKQYISYVRNCDAIAADVEL